MEQNVEGTPPNDAATATEPAVCPAAVAIAANPLAPITGTSACNVGARAVNPAAIAGAARPVKRFSQVVQQIAEQSHQDCF